MGFEVAGLVAAGELAAGLVADDQGAPLGAADQAVGAAEGEDVALVVEDGGVEVGVAGEFAGGVGFDAADALDVAGRVRSSVRGGGGRRGGRRSRGNVVSRGIGGGLVGGELVGVDLDDDQGPVFAGAVFGGGGQEGAGDVEHGVGERVGGDGVGVFGGAAVIRGAGAVGASVPDARGGGCAVLVFGGGEGGEEEGGFFGGEAETDVDGAVVAGGPGQAAVALLVEPGAGGGAVAGDGGGELGGGGGEGELAQLGVIDQIDHAGRFADLGVRQSAFAERLTDRGHPTQGAGDPDVFASGAGGHRAGPGQPVREGCHAVPPADGVAGVEVADQLEQSAL